MCKLKSGIILKNRVFVPEYDSHTDMLEELGIEDDYFNAGKTFVRVELSPENGDAFSDIDTWKLNVDQDIVPDWYDEETYKPQVVEAVKKWAEGHIHNGVNGLRIDTGRNHYIKDCNNVVICGNASVKRVCGNTLVTCIYDSASIIYIYGNTSVENIYDSVSVENIYDSASIENIYNSATIKCICGNASVENICDHAMIKYICGNASVENIYGNATVKRIYDSATVKCIYGSTTVERIYDHAMIKRIYDSATVERICGNAKIKNIYGNATIISSPCADWYNKSSLTISDNATFKDNFTKIIHQSGDWKFVNKE